MTTAIESPPIMRRILPKISIELSAFWVTAALMTVAIMFPVAMSIDAAFRIDGAFSLEGFERLFRAPRIGRIFTTTLIFSAGATVAAAAIGVTLAWVVARTDVPARRFLEIMCVVPLFMSAFVGAIAWRLILVPRAGMLTRILTDWGYPIEWVPDVYSLTSMCVIQGVFYSPFMYLYAVASFRQMDPSLEEVSRIHGASGWQTLRRVTLPINGPALLSGMLVVFVFSIGTLEIPIALGVPGGNYVISTRIWTLLRDFPQDVPQAMALGFLAIMMAGAGIWLQKRLLGNRKFTTVTGKGYNSRVIELGKWKWPTFAAVFSYVVIAVILPIVVLLLIGLQRTWRGRWHPELFTLDNFYSVAFLMDVTSRAIVNSLIACTIAATIVVLIATILSQTKSRSAEAWMGMLVLMPIAIPGVIFGVMVLYAFIRTPMYQTLSIIIFAYVIGNFFLAYRIIYSVRLSIHPELEQSARIHGASWWRSTYLILMPLLRPGIFSAWLMSFVIFMREFSSVMFLYWHGTEVMSVVFFLLMERHSARLAAFMIIQIALLLVVMAIYQRVNRRASGGMTM